MSIHLATSYSKLLPLTEFAGTPHWTVLSTHRHACNLVAADGMLVALVNEIHGNGPFHIVVPGIRFDDLTPATSVRWQDGQIEVTPIVIDLQSAAPWSPRLPLLTQALPHQSLANLASLATMRSPLTCGPTVLTARAQRAIQCIRQGFTQQNSTLILQGTTLLAGLGPGLTPAGDDFLVGLLAALWTSGVEVSISELCREIAKTAATQTTRLSAAWLLCAGRGDLGEQWHELIAALNRNDPTTADHAGQRILNRGATSGADALCGFFVGLRAAG